MSDNDVHVGEEPPPFPAETGNTVDATEAEEAEETSDSIDAAEDAGSTDAADPEDEPDARIDTKPQSLGMIRAATAWHAATGSPWAPPLVVGLAALLIGGALGYLLQPDPTTSQEYLSMVDERDSQLGQVVDGLRREKRLREELQPLQEQAAEFDDRESALDKRETDLDDREAELDQREEDIAAAEETIEKNTIPGNGIYLVGEDVKAGTYRSSGTGGCYWARLSSTDGEFDSIITNNYSDGAQVVTIRSSDVAFETSRCGEWTRVN